MPDPAPQPPQDALEPWQAMCPDCDHGIRGGFPCGTCQGRGHVTVVLADPAAAQRLGEQAIANGWTPIDTIEGARARYQNAHAPYVSRAWMYLDVGHLCAEIEQLRAMLRPETLAAAVDDALGFNAPSTPHDMAVDLDGRVLPIGPDAVRASVRELLHTGTLRVLVIERGEELAVHTLGAPSIDLVAVLEQTAAGFRQLLAKTH